MDRDKIIEYCDYLGVPKRSGQRLSQRERARWRPAQFVKKKQEVASERKARGAGHS